MKVETGTRKGRAAAIAAALIVLLAAGWWLGSPWWTLWRMREAARAGDSAALAGYVDFPALRASVREQLGLGPLGGLVAGPAVDALVSPRALRLALGNGRSGGGGAGHVALVRAGASEFRVRRERGDLVFRRHGLGWKLAEIRLSSAP
ncbi:MAG TPA: DUF2939 domain-containing protein [Allosphingosinicella sp.]|jgi:hypothetical protein|nr:DUF2939 domain-containing protein [Allosphingosinicella sp.]